jgi:hypothetical protein
LIILLLLFGDYMYFSTQMPLQSRNFCSVLICGLYFGKGTYRNKGVEGWLTNHSQFDYG